jgi:hypothetical protein
MPIRTPVSNFDAIIDQDDFTATVQLCVAAQHGGVFARYCATIEEGQ